MTKLNRFVMKMMIVGSSKGNGRLKSGTMRLLRKGRQDCRGGGGRLLLGRTG